ncbi:hypothetical protein L218DRAFT_863235, partial [Marasmius fiardii PR-910]
VLGKGSLPTYADRSSFPYIEAILCETLRWTLIIPLVFPYMATVDDTMDGYFFSQGEWLLCPWV